MAGSSLECVLRVGGDDFDIDAALSNITLQPYRIDKAGIDRIKINALHYNVFHDEVSTSEMLSSAIERFISENTKSLLFLRQMKSIEYFELDVALMIYEEMPMRTLTLSKAALKLMADVGLAYTVSVYKAGDT